jgi:hypothetical protein
MAMRYLMNRDEVLFLVKSDAGPLIFWKDSFWGSAAVRGGRYTEQAFLSGWIYIPFVKMSCTLEGVSFY